MKMLLILTFCQLLASWKPTQRPILIKTGGGSSELQDLKKLKEVKFVNFVSFQIGENLLKNLFWPKYCMIRFVVKIYILISSSRAETAPPGAASDLYIYTCASLAQVPPIRCFALWENFFSFEICCLHYMFPIGIFLFLNIFLHNQSNDQNVIRRDEEISLVFVTKKWRHEMMSCIWSWPKILQKQLCSWHHSTFRTEFWRFFDKF